MAILRMFHTFLVFHFPCQAMWTLYLLWIKIPHPVYRQQHPAVQYTVFVYYTGSLRHFQRLVKYWVYYRWFYIIRHVAYVVVAPYPFDVKQALNVAPDPAVPAYILAMTETERKMLRKRCLPHPDLNTYSPNIPASPAACPPHRLGNLPVSLIFPLHAIYYTGKFPNLELLG